eukprot:2451890-Amphidinium_carterae.1
MDVLPGLSSTVDIYAGYSEDAIPQLPKVLNGQQADVVFMDLTIVWTPRTLSLIHISEPTRPRLI